MTGKLAEDLAAREKADKPVRVGLVGCGEMGTDIVTQVTRMPGIRVAAAVDVDPARVRAAVRIAELDTPVVDCASADRVDAVIDQGSMACCDDFGTIFEAENIDVVIDATGVPDIGAQVAIGAMEHGKHIVMMNVEADVTIGPYLLSRAQQAGVVYTLGAGDEPSSTMELIHFVRSLGAPIVAAGKGKNNPLDPTAVPADYEEEAARRNMNPRMLVEFIDGSKAMIEMVAIANATGLVPDVPGMHGPNASRDTLQDVLCPREDGGVLYRKGVVDYTVSPDVAPAVFVIAEMSHPRLRERMHDLKLGPGPYYTFIRPYHLTSLEVPLSAAEAVLYGSATMHPLPVPTSEVTALAKRDLPAGTRLDAIGESCYHGWADTREDAVAKRALPLGLAYNAVTTRDIAAGEYLTYDNCTPDDSQLIVRLRREQDRMLGGA
ncbi:MAG TPA: homoserine dehydrogenase [Gammaproteobacteria bacterium]|nr:homoserine dehydrogenase [Gammaproteobacteria bacterium]